MTLNICLITERKSVDHIEYKGIQWLKYKDVFGTFELGIQDSMVDEGRCIHNEISKIIEDDFYAKEVHVYVHGDI